ncbi:hypothetical protein QZH41_018996, partial [Actinostola sp. cb2023]
AKRHKSPSQASRHDYNRRTKTMDKMCTVLFLLSFGFGLLSCANVSIYIGGFVELNTSLGGWNSAGILPAVELAQRHINEQTNILKGIDLQVDMKDSKCSSAYSIKGLVEHIMSPHTKIAILGPGCSISAQPVADSAHFWNLVQVAYGAGTPRLSDKTRYPLFFRVNSPETIPNLAIVALLKYFKWGKVAIVKEDVSVFNDVNENLHILLRSNNITVISTNSFVNDPTNVVRDLLEKDARIIIALMYEGKCRKLMCAAYKHGLLGNHLLWLLRGWYEYRWWNVSDTACTGDELRTAIGNYIGIEEKILSTDDRKTVSGRTPSQLQSLYLAKVKSMSFPRNSYAPYGYDALWTIALALNHSIAILARTNKTLSDFNYQSNDMAAIFTRMVANTSFRGMSGEVEFEKHGDRINNLWIEQLQDDDEVKVGVFYTKRRQTSVDLIKLSQSFVWPGGKIPKSEAEIVETLNKINIKLFITMATMACLGICMACAFLCFNIAYRKNSHIRMSSPDLNNLIIIGSLMCYVCVFLLGSAAFLDETQPSAYRVTCIIRLWLMSCGFTLAFGTMFVKTWRVYKMTLMNWTREQDFLMKSFCWRLLCSISEHYGVDDDDDDDYDINIDDDDDFDDGNEK